MTTQKPVGWRQESARHALARKGIKTGTKTASAIKKPKKLTSLSSVKAQLKKMKPDYFAQREFLDNLDKNEFDVQENNTYNYAEHLYDTWEYKTIQKKDADVGDQIILVAWRHLGGDVRGNYSDKPVIIQGTMEDVIGGFSPDNSYLYEIQSNISDKDFKKFKEGLKQRGETFGEQIYKIFGKNPKNFKEADKNLQKYTKKTLGKEFKLEDVNMSWGLYTPQNIDATFEGDGYFEISQSPKEAMKKGYTTPIYTW